MLFRIDNHTTTLGKNIVVCTGTDYLNPFSLLKEIREEWIRINKSTPTEMLFDMYYTNGNSDNRFAKMEFDGNQFNPSTFSIVPIQDLDAEIVNIQNQKFNL
ncbi:type II toxin-antitoxin system RnlB family antitoxin [Ursidibacter sp. B-7004-1]